jgi:hypothetical protein
LGDQTINKGGTKMDVYSFISAIIDSLVWPVVILVVFFVLKKPLSQLLLGLNKLRYNNLELDFGMELAKLEKTLEKQINTKEINIKSEIKDEKEIEIKAVAEINPSRAISMAWSMVEQEIVTTINRLAISPNFPAYNSILTNINLLLDNNLVDEHTYAAINEFRVIRNKVSRSYGREQKTYLEAIKYYEIAVKFINHLKQIKKVD